MQTIPSPAALPRRLLLIKSAKYANQPGYYLHNGRWHAVKQDKPAPKGAPVAAHPHAAGKFMPIAHFTDAEWEKLKLPPENTNAGSFNGQLAKLKQMSNAGDVTGILASGFGTNTYGKKLAIIANKLLGLHGSEHQVAPGQKIGTHAAVAQASAAPTKDEALQAAVDHLKEDAKQGDLPAKEKAEDTALVQKLEAAKDQPPAEAGESGGAKISPTVTFYHYGKHADATTLAPLTFFTADKKSSESYAANGEGALHAVKLDIKNAATDEDVKAAAKKLGIMPEDVGMPDEEFVMGFEYLSPHLLGDKAKQVMQELQAQGFDGAQFANDFDLNGQMIPGGSVVIFDSKQVKQDNGGDVAPAAGGLAMPAFEEGKATTGVIAYYEKVAQQILAMAAAGDTAGLEKMKADGLKPNSKGKVSNTFKGKTANSKMLLALHAQALSAGDGKTPDAPTADQAAPAVSPEPVPAPAAPAAEASPPVAEPQAAPVTQAAADGGKLAQIPWDSLKLPESNSNAKQHNGTVDKIKTLAEAGDVDGLQALYDKKSGSKQTYIKKQALLAQTALAALKESAPAPAVAPVEDGPKEGDTKQGADGMLILKDGHWVKMEQAPPAAPKGVSKPKKASSKKAATGQPSAAPGALPSMDNWVQTGP